MNQLAKLDMIDNAIPRQVEQLLSNLHLSGECRFPSKGTHQNFELLLRDYQSLEPGP